MSKPVNNNVDTFRLGKRTNAMNATQRPIPIASISNQWPVKTQIQTIVTDNENETSSAGVKRPHIPNEILNNLNRKEYNQFNNVI